MLRFAEYSAILTKMGQLNIRLLRQWANQNDNAVARLSIATGNSTSFVEKLLNGRYDHSIKMATVRQISKCTKIPMDHLYTEIELPYPKASGES